MMHYRRKSTFYFFFQIKTHLNQINYKLLIEYNVLKCNLIL